MTNHQNKQRQNGFFLLAAAWKRAKELHRFRSAHLGLNTPFLEVASLVHQKWLRIMAVFLCHSFSWGELPIGSSDFTLEDSSRSSGTSHRWNIHETARWCEQSWGGLGTTLTGVSRVQGEQNLCTQLLKIAVSSHQENCQSVGYGSVVDVFFQANFKLYIFLLFFFVPDFYTPATKPW